jgi:signal transduction histidine kinase
MTTLINDLLTLARSDGGSDAIPRKEADLGSIVGETCNQFASLHSGRDLAVTIEEPLPPVWGDDALLRRLVMILLDNASCHTPADTSVRVGLERRGNAALLTVADDGEGIPAESLEKVFDRFYRVDTSRSRSTGGLGLGLSIAKWISDAHNGTIEVSSEAGNGSTFSVRIPFGTA